MATFTGWLRARSDEQLRALLRLRPDLASPSPVTFPSLAARASARTALERALAGVDAAGLQVLEAVVVLDPPTSRAAVLAAVAGTDEADRAQVARALDDVRDRALAIGDDDELAAAPGVSDLLGRWPAGLWPSDRAADSRAPRDVAGTLAQAPPGAAQVLGTLTWGPPLGVRPAPATRADATVAWLVAHGLLLDAGERRVALPRPVALALRAGRTHRQVARPPDPAGVTAHRDRDLVDVESAAAAERTVRLVARLIGAWSQPPSVLRSGGLGVRDLRRTAALLDADEEETAFVVELAATAGLVLADDGAFVPSTDADAWLTGGLAQRWAALARSWLVTSRAAWLVGGRDERGATRTALHPDGQRSWAPALRRSVLGVLADLPAGAAPDAEQVLDRLAWHTPRAIPPAGVVAAQLVEAARLGVTGAGALAPAGRALATGDDPTQALTASLPAPVHDLLLQGDLTGVVPGRPAPELADLLDLAGVVESRGGALTVRFTPASVRAALDAGLTADTLLDRLAAAARGGVPQALTYLVRDEARRYGAVRVGAAAAYLRSDDPTLLAPLLADPALTGLGLVALAPTVLVASVPAAQVAAVLRERGLAAVTEGPDGQLLDLREPARRAPARAPREPEQPAAREARLGAVLAQLRAAEGAAPPAAVRPSSAPAPAEGTSRPAEGLVLLREAAAQRQAVWVELVGPTGATDRRLLRPLSLDGGRLRALDEARQAEITVVVHRIAAVSRPQPRTPEEVP